MLAHTHYPNIQFKAILSYVIIETSLNYSDYISKKQKKFTNLSIMENFNKLLARCYLKKVIKIPENSWKKCPLLFKMCEHIITVQYNKLFLSSQIRDTAHNA